MAQRRFGPTRGAGVAVIEKEGEKTIAPAALGWVGYAGILEKGPTDALIFAQNKKAFNRICGSYIDDSLLPDCCEDYYKIANGAGGIMLYRVTDGNELQSEITLYCRKPAGFDGSEFHPHVPMGTIKAHNGGRWGGKESAKCLLCVDNPTPNTLVVSYPDDSEMGWTKDQWKGAKLRLDGVDNVEFEVVESSVEDKATATLTLRPDIDVADYVPDPFSGMAGIWLENDDKALSVLITDGEENPDSEFGLSVYVDGALVKKYPNLSTNPTSPRYWTNIINNDSGNWEIKVTDLWTGSHTADVRPANLCGFVTEVTETVLTCGPMAFAINSPTGGNPTFTPSSPLNPNAKTPQKLTITMTSATEGTVESDLFGGVGDIEFGTEWDPVAGTGGAYKSDWMGAFTIAAGATPMVAGDTITVDAWGAAENSLVGGRVYPNKGDYKNKYYRIVANDFQTITVADGNDLTAITAAGKTFIVEIPQELKGGRDGVSEVSAATYINGPWEPSTSLFNRIVGRNLGLVKFATPGLPSDLIETVSKAGVAYAEAKNHQYRYEFPAECMDEETAMTVVNDWLGRSDFAVGAFPTYGYVVDPFDTGEGKLKLVSNVGMIHGREARIAADYDGYHKAEAGEDATLPMLLNITTTDAVLDEERLNPVGIAVIKKVKGNYVIWGDRTFCIDPTWKWKHQREQISHYEHVLQENFGWIVFSINDITSDKLALVTLRAFFKPEWQPKRALRGDKFEDAAIIKMDAENNTDATRAAGDKNAEISLRLADTTERFVITIGKQGIFESVA